VEVGL